MPHTNEDTEKEIENEEVQTEDLQPNLQTGSITVQKNGHFIHCLTVIGQIEGHYILPSQNKTTKYEHVIPQLVAIEESDDVEGLLIILNTVGGDVEAGLAIAAIVGILLNAILPGNDYEFDAANGSDAPSSGNLQV